MTISYAHGDLFRTNVCEADDIFTVSDFFASRYKLHSFSHNSYQNTRNNKVSSSLKAIIGLFTDIWAFTKYHQVSLYDSRFISTFTNFGQFNFGHSHFGQSFICMIHVRLNTQRRCTMLCYQQQEPEQL